MSKKAFLVVRIITVITLSILVGVSINLGNYVLPVVAIITASFLLYFFKGKVKEVMADERDYEIAGRAGRNAMTIYSLIMAIIGTVLMALSKTYPELESPALIVLYSVCFLVLLYSILFKIYSRYGK
ncbi:MAG: DUF2178 domain-containing protein [Patescibacteria group bacterium]|nr:DUF2178 domain-containing protein [Patescibacteria group bacterium]MDD5294774.1 DUF2178 domain-containing protein [Patescibacteria group bacterium]MDD5554342.1 DUF2178 domain-containing protein [Patescibacteria group bacterium]